jgi:hypothetical protein
MQTWKIPKDQLKAQNSEGLIPTLVLRNVCAFKGTRQQNWSDVFWFERPW